MSEGLVGLGHLVSVLTLLHGAAKVVGSIHDLAGQTLLHGLLAAVAGIGGQPAQAQGLTALGPYTNKNRMDTLNVHQIGRAHV